MLLEVAVAQTGSRDAMKPLQGNPQGVLKTTDAGDTGTVTAPTPVSTNLVTLLAANTSRTGLTIFNDSTQVLHVKLSAVDMSAATDRSYTIAAGAIWPVPFGYSGRVQGWLGGVDAAARARCTEITTA